MGTTGLAEHPEGQEKAGAEVISEPGGAGCGGTQQHPPRQGRQYEVWTQAIILGAGSPGAQFGSVTLGLLTAQPLCTSVSSL